MKLSYEGIGAWSATFATETAVAGQVVKMSGTETVAACADGEAFCGVARNVRNGVCAVQLGGLTEVAYSGGAPAVGQATLVANGQGGVRTNASGQSVLVIAVDEGAEKCVIKL